VLDYQLPPGVDVNSVDYVETQIIPADPQLNFAKSTGVTQAGKGIFYSVGIPKGETRPEIFLVHRRNLGFVFTPRFSFTLRPAVEGPSSDVSVMATLYSIDRATPLARLTAPATGRFAVGARLPLDLQLIACEPSDTAPGLRQCDDRCVDVTSDALHCGSCGGACPAGMVCGDGRCRCSDGSLPNLSEDSLNCGACGQACRPGERCKAGLCQCETTTGTSTCAQDQVCCADGCQAQCLCAGSTPVDGGTSSGGGTVCQTDQLCCGGDQCIDVSSSPDHCGACGRACPKGTTCISGSCRCSAADSVSCDLDGGARCCGAPGSERCTDVKSSGANCGQCGAACGAGQYCSGGQCLCGQTACAAGQSCCGGSCVTASSDPKHCGACGVTCNTGESCVGGKCQCGATGQACSPGMVCFPMTMNGISAGCYQAREGESCPPGSQELCGLCFPTGDLPNSVSLCNN
jgi:hypothetical protein